MYFEGLIKLRTVLVICAGYVGAIVACACFLSVPHAAYTCSVFFDDPLVEIVAAIGVVSFFTFAQLATRPFNQRVLNQLEACGLMVTFCVQLASILYWRVDSSAGFGTALTLGLTLLVGSFVAACVFVAMRMLRVARNRRAKLSQSISVAKTMAARSSAVASMIRPRARRPGGSPPPPPVAGFPTPPSVELTPTANPLFQRTRHAPEARRPRPEPQVVEVGNARKAASSGAASPASGADTQQRAGATSRRHRVEMAAKRGRGVRRGRTRPSRASVASGSAVLVPQRSPSPTPQSYFGGTE